MIKSISQQPPQPRQPTPRDLGDLQPFMHQAIYANKDSVRESWLSSGSDYQGSVASVGSGQKQQQPKQQAMPTVNQPSSSTSVHRHHIIPQSSAEELFQRQIMECNMQQQRQQQQQHLQKQPLYGSLAASGTTLPRASGRRPTPPLATNVSGTLGRSPAAVSGSGAF